MAVVLVVKGHLLALKSLVEKKGDISRMKKQKRTSLALLLGSVMALSMVSTPVQAEGNHHTFRSSDSDSFRTARTTS